MKASETPLLAPPGAGLPLIQRLAIKIWLGPVVSKRSVPLESRAYYEKITAKLMAAARGVEASQRKLKILVPPIPGLEDSSRFWSINELLEHLLIVSRGIETVILSLSEGVVPDGEADIAKVKPRGTSVDPLAEFSAYAPALFARMDEELKKPGRSLNQSRLFKHPWFGPINAHQWYWLLSSHQGIHWRQAKEIIQRLPRV